MQHIESLMQTDWQEQHGLTRHGDVNSRGQANTKLPYSSTPTPTPDIISTCLGIINRQKTTIIITTLAAALPVVMLVAVREPLYSASVRLQIQEQALRIVEAGNVTSTPARSHQDIRTLHQLLSSRSLAERVARRLQLASDDEFLRQRRGRPWRLDILARTTANSTRPANNTQAARHVAVLILQRQRRTRPVVGSRLVDIIYSDTNPRRASRIANAFADAFVSSNLERHTKAAAYAKRYLEMQIDDYRERLRHSEHVLLAFAARNDIVSNTDADKIAEHEIMEANAALTHLTAARIRTEQQWRQANNVKNSAAAAPALTQFLSNPAISNLRSKRKSLISQYKELLATYKPAYPAVTRLANKVSETERQIAQEVAAVRASLRAAYVAARDQEARMGSRIRSLRAQLHNRQKHSIRYSILKRDAETNRQLYRDLLRRYKEIDLAAGADTNHITVVDRAKIPTEPSSPPISQALLLSLASGIGLGFAVAYLRDAATDVLRTPEDVERTLAAPVLATMPRLPSRTAIIPQLLRPATALSEACRTLATTLQNQVAVAQSHIVCISSTSTGEGKSTVALGLARHSAGLGRNVLLIDACLRRPVLHKMLFQANGAGLSDYLSARQRNQTLVKPTDVPGFAFLSAGAPPRDASQLLASPALPLLLRRAAEVFDLVVIDAPSLTESCDVQMITRAGAELLLVIAPNEVSPARVHRALCETGITTNQIGGIILNKHRRPSSKFCGTLSPTIHWPMAIQGQRSGPWSCPAPNQNPSRRSSSSPR